MVDLRWESQFAQDFVRLFTEVWRSPVKMWWRSVKSNRVSQKAQFASFGVIHRNDHLICGNLWIRGGLLKRVNPGAEDTGRLQLAEPFIGG